MNMRTFVVSAFLLATAFAQARGQTSTLVYPGAGGRLQYQPFANWGESNAVNQIPDFSHAGYRGGGVPLPIVPVVEFLDPVPGDACTLIQDAIDRVSARPKDANGFRGAILLKSGRYFVEGGLLVRADGVVLRGEGQNTPENGGTEIIATARTQHTLIRIVGSEAAGGAVSEAVLDSRLYPPQNTIAEYNVLSGVAGELEGDRVITFHLFTDANQYTHYGSREDSEYRRPVLELTVARSGSGIDTLFLIRPIADAYVRGGPDSLHNFGADSSLPIKYSGEGAATTREAYIKFDLSPVGDSLKAAKLKLYAKYDLTRPDVTVPVLTHYVSVIDDDSWGEMTITYGNRPRPARTDAIRRITTDYVPSGVTQFAVADVVGLAVGDSIKVVRTPNDTWINTLDMAQYGWVAANYRTRYERVITAIDGTTITINIPLVQAMEGRFGGGEIYREAARGRVSNCGVESMLLSSVYAGDDDELHGWTAVSLTQAADCWVQNVTARYFGYSCITLDWAFNTTVQNCAMLDPKSITTGSRKYSFNINKGSFNLFQRCFTRGGRHDFVTGSQVAGPNVFVDCAAVQTFADIGPHHRYATGVLFDNINGGEMRVQNRRAMGSGHGWAGAQTMFWNCVSNAGEFKVESPAGALNWGIGGAGILKAGAGFWEQYGSTVTPRSLYFQQLQDRLGLQAAENVMMPRQRQGPIWNFLVAWGGYGDLSSILSSAEDRNDIPAAFALDQNYPNPFNPSTTLRYRLPVASRIDLRVYDLLGREVSVLIDGKQSAGSRTVVWNAGKHPSGFYFYRFQAAPETGGRFSDTKTMILLK